VLGDDASDFFVVFGVNHEATGKARYSNFGVTSGRKHRGVASVTSDRLFGSASVYLPYHPQARYLYAWKVKRHCGAERYCLEVHNDGSLGVPVSSEVGFSFRAYMDPENTVGPDPEELVFSRVIKSTSGVVEEP